jgi:hypothetical protein
MFMGSSVQILLIVFMTVIASEAKQSSFLRCGNKAGLLRRFRSSQ